MAEEVPPGLYPGMPVEEEMKEDRRAYMREIVAEAAMEALRGPKRQRRPKNPFRVPDPAFDAVASVNGSCRRIVELVDRHGPQFIVGGCVDEGMRERSEALLRRTQEALGAVLAAIEQPKG